MSVVRAMYEDLFEKWPPRARMLCEQKREPLGVPSRASFWDRQAPESKEKEKPVACRQTWILRAGISN